MLCEKKDLARTSSMPGKTQLINYFLINGSWYLVDLPGYGFAKLSKKMQSDMKQMIQTFIGESEELSMLFVLIDARHVLMEIDRNFISAVAGAGVPFAVVFTKSDKMTSSALKKVCGENIAQIERIAPDTPSFITSAEKRKGREELLDFIETIYNKHTDIQSI